MNLYVTTAEIKTFLGINGSSQDTLLAMLNKQATARLNSILGVSDLALHKVTEEVRDAIGTRIRLKDVHVQAIGTITDDDETYTQEEDYDIDDYILNLENDLSGEPRKLLIDYVAGWNASGMAKITVTDYASIPSNATITLGAVSSDGFTLTRGVSWTAGTSNENEASKIATALDSQAGVRAFALGNVVYVIEDTNPQVNTRTIATSDSTRLALSDSILRSVDFPEDLRMAVFLLVAGMKQKTKNPNVKSYTVGGKSVTFADETTFNEFKSIIGPYKRAFIYAV